MKYPSVFRRYLATLLDLLVLWSYVYLVTRIPAVIESDGRVGVAVLPVQMHDRAMGISAPSQVNS